MFAELTIEGHMITFRNVKEFEIAWHKVVDNIRAKSNMTLIDIAEKTDISLSKIRHASACNSCKFCKCEMMALLYLYHEFNPDADIGLISIKAG